MEDNKIAEETPVTFGRRVAGWWARYQFVAGVIVGGAAVWTGSFLRSKRN